MMTEGERFVGSLPVKANFHDRSKRRSYDRTRAIAVHMVDDPTLIRNGHSFLERVTRRDPRQSRYYAMWKDLLRLDVRQVVERMLEDSPEGDLLRDTQPVFVVLPMAERMTAVPRHLDEPQAVRGALIA